MKKVLLMKEIYLEAFKNLGHIILKQYFKAFSIFCFCLIALVIYAFLFRVFTGFSF
ncbi:hypothetical protein SAMN04487911_10126 [Arenibacter nanhaiticus]|uniref:Uncharacterized protein n=1 Tax=Arenibacter nanhaiticus TaxID=558155 RepID=A0A1M6A0Z5_9FLAO|nr:DUF6747 family protein [Arenibacter nanhaiticus]SHI30191.1 hypothetical protein SAMN04487911_10126 [Arenibacter nanhaiticus]